jgi:5-methyltetrahydrofolate--homocysteine methyltransferase
MAMASGLDAAIINPLDATLLATIRAAELLAGRDPGAGRYLADAPLLSDIETSAGPALRSGLAGQSKAEIACDALPCFRALADAIIRGDHEAAVNAVNVLLEEGHQPVETVNGGVIPALDAVGRLYDASAHAAQRVCDTALARLEASGASACPGRILLATVEGDLHDLGKNVVGTILKSHGYAVTDLGKDVPTAEILAAAGRERPDIVGLSALMTSTMEEMERAARQLKARFPGIRVMVGGASVNQAFADRIGADGYAGDAVASVRLVTRLLHGGEAR